MGRPRTALHCVTVQCQWRAGNATYQAQAKLGRVESSSKEGKTEYHQCLRGFSQGMLLRCSALVSSWAFGLTRAVSRFEGRDKLSKPYCFRA